MNEKICRLLGVEPIFKELFCLSFLYSNPTANSKIMKKKESAYDLLKIKENPFIRNNILSFILMFGLYFMFTFQIDFNTFPVVLDIFTVFMILFALGQNFMYIYNLFYEANDLEGYMPLPISERTVYFSKILSMAVSTSTITIPVFSSYIMFFIRKGFSVLGVIYAFMFFLIITALVIELGMIITDAIARNKKLSSNRKGIFTAINVASIVINIAMILMLSNFKNLENEGFFKGFSGKESPASFLFASHLSTIITIIAGIAVVYLLYIFTFRKVNEGFYRTVADSKNDIKKTVKIKKGFKNLDDVFFSYNKSLVNSESTVIQFIISNYLVTGMIFIPTLIILRKELDFGGSPLSHQIGILLSVIIGIELLTKFFTGNSLQYMILSLDRENFEYIKALPVSFKDYIRSKNRYVARINLVGDLLIFIALALFLRVSPVSILAVIILVPILNYLFTMQGIIYDYNHLNTKWQSLLDLSNRSGKFITFVKTMLIMIAVFAFESISVVMALNGEMKKLMLINIAALIVLLLATFIRTELFMKKLED